MGKSRLQVEDGTKKHPSSRQHDKKQTPTDVVLPQLKASTPTRINAKGQVVKKVQLHESNSEAYSPDQLKGSLADTLDTAVSGQLGHIAELADSYEASGDYESAEAAAELMDALAAEAAESAAASESFWSFYEQGDNGRY
jgi:hypothetical protein